MADEELAFAPITRQAQLIRAGDISSRELVELYLGRIERLDPQLNAFRAVYGERALAEADQAAARLKAGDERPLLGVPLAIKDNTDVAGDVTTHGTSAYGEPASRDAEVVRRVRAAGAVVLGKTQVPPLCAMAATESSTFGISRNPWDLDRSPAGSSGGSAAAVAAGLVGAALGSDGAGSIRMPAASCALFGLKPARGRISLAPLPEHWYGMTVYGWLTRTVADNAFLLDLTSGAAPGDADRAPDPVRPFTEAAGLPPGRLRVAYSFRVPPGTFGVRVHDEVRRAVLDSAELLRSLGHDVMERDPDFPNETGSAGTIRVLRGVADEAFTLAHPERIDRRFRRIATAAARIPDATVAWARSAEASVWSRIGRLWDECDVLLAPVIPEPPIKAGRWEGRGALWTLNAQVPMIAFTSPWNQTGQPAASVPAGRTADGLPLAVQLVGRPGDETTLLSLAAAIEAQRPWTDRRPPVA